MEQFLGDMCFRAFGEERVNKNHRDLMLEQNPEAKEVKNYEQNILNYRHDIQYQNQEKEEELAYLASGFNPFERSLVKIESLPQLGGWKEKILETTT